MENTRSARAEPSPREARRRSPWRTGLKLAAGLLFVLSALGMGAAFAVLGQFQGTDPVQTLVQIPRTVRTVLEPRRFFPGQDRLVVLCLGLDRNIMRSRDPRLNGMPYTKGARSDVMMVAGLDLASQSVTILSIPRDTRVRLAGRRDYSKINEAHARGGIPFTRRAVEEFLGIQIDHHVVIKQEAIEEMVDALGGLQLNVEKDMDYDDNWGQLHVHLKAGEQLLVGSDVVGYMRFRHDAEGDFGRIRRQQQVIQVLADRVQNPQVLLKAGPLIQAIRTYVQTDLSPDQQLALAHLFHRIQAGNVQTVSMPVEDTAMIDGLSYVIPDEARLAHAVDWVVRGNLEAMNRLIRVEVRDASGDPDTYRRVYRYLRHEGFEAWRAGAARDGSAEVTRVVQRTNLRGAGRRLLDSMGLTGAVEKLDESGADVTIYVGKDLVASPMLAFADSLPEPPDYRPRRRRASYRSRKPRENGVQVQIRTVGADAPAEAAPQPEEPRDPVEGEPPPAGAGDPAPAAPGEPPGEPGSAS